MLSFRTVSFRMANCCWDRYWKLYAPSNHQVLSITVLGTIKGSRWECDVVSAPREFLEKKVANEAVRFFEQIKAILVWGHSCYSLHSSSLHTQCIVKLLFWIRVKHFKKGESYT